MSAAGERGGVPLIAVVRPDDTLEWMREAAAVEPDRYADAANVFSYFIRAGLKAALQHAPDAAMIALADMPFVSAEQYCRVAEALN